MKNKKLLEKLAQGKALWAYEYLGLMIQMLRRQERMSQQDLAYHSGIDRSTLSKIETGVTRNPQIFHISGIATKLGVPLSLLITPTNGMGIVLANYWTK